MMTLIRLILSKIILVLDWFTTPKSVARDPEAQARVDAQTQKLAIYEFRGCPFCVKVRRHVKRLGLNIVLKDVQKDEKAKQELLSGAGEYQVPCLRITQSDGTVKWMYESSDINEYLTQQFS